MRLWSIHPEYLDAKGLVALWREGLLAQKVLQGETAGYRNHPQLVRFRNTRNPLGAIATYLRAIFDEAERRGYHFNSDKIINRRLRSTLPVTDGQLGYEFQHLLNKLKQRDREIYMRIRNTKQIKAHPLFSVQAGKIESWEIR